MITLDEMDRIEAFKNLSDDQLSTIQEFCNSVEYQQNDRLFAEGDDAKHLWVIIDGQVDLRFELPNSSLADDKSTISSVSRMQVCELFREKNIKNIEIMKEKHWQR